MAKALTLEQSNAKFNALPKMKQRVKICEDALLQIKIGKFNITSGTYFNLTVPTRTADEYYAMRNEPNAQKAIATEGAICAVCARGAIFASRCLLGNDARNPLDKYTNFFLEEDKAVAPIFGAEMLELIEYLFENGCVGDCPDGYEDVADRWVKQQYDNSAEHRMKLILKNIIRNKGKLVLYHKTIK